MTTYPIVGSLVDIDNTYSHTKAAYAPDAEKFAVFYPYNDGFGARVAAKVITATDFSLSLSARSILYVAEFTNTYNCDVCYDTTNSCFIVGYVVEGNGRLYLRKGTFSGDTIVGSAAADVTGASIGGTAYTIYQRRFVHCETSGKTVVYFVKPTDGTLNYVVVDASGAPISVGAITSLGVSKDFSSCVNNTTGEHLLVYESSGVLKGRIGTISDFTISFSAEFTIHSSHSTTTVYGVSCAFDENTERWVVGSKLTTENIRFNSFLAPAGVIAENTYADVVGAGSLEIVYDGSIKKVVGAFRAHPTPNRIVCTSITPTETETIAKTIATVSTERDAVGSLIYSVRDKKTLISAFWWSAATVKDAVFMAQLDEDAPTAWWTNFSGQTEIIV